MLCWLEFYLLEITLVVDCCPVAFEVSLIVAGVYDLGVVLCLILIVIVLLLPFVCVCIVIYVLLFCFGDI